MTSPIGPSEQNKIQAVDNQIQQYIEQAQAGQQLDTKGMANLEQQITSLCKNAQIPANVQQSLQMAANELKQMRGGKGGVNNLLAAKMQLDSLLGGNENESIEQDAGEQKTGESSLGEGGSGEQ